MFMLEFAFRSKRCLGQFTGVRRFSAFAVVVGFGPVASGRERPVRRRCKREDRRGEERRGASDAAASLSKVLEPRWDKPTSPMLIDGCVR